MLRSLEIHGLRICAFLLFLFVGTVPASAIEVHNFDCKNCHKTGISYTDLGNAATNICLDCHKENPPSVTMLDGTSATPTGLFTPTDASNAMGTYPEGLAEDSGPGSQTSHIWAGRDVMEPAGAQAPTNRLFYGRYGISTGKLTCQRCHDPHSRDATNTKLLRLGTGSREQMCIDCHAPWNLDNTDHGLLTHPLVADYEAVQTANPDKYKPAADVSTSPGEIELVNGSVVCSSCHGTHFADSDGATTDGPQQTLSAGDGKILRADGPESADKSVLCQSCHTYKPHGSATEIAGCLVCHSGHSYNGGTPNYYVLRDSAITATYGAVANLSYTDLSSDLGGSSSTVELWAGTAGSADGYCERCHGELTTMANSTRTHVEGEDCNGCHSHNGTSMTYSFEANCTDCHGWPPSDATQGGPSGFAYDSANGYDYSAVAEYKDESFTPHTSHTGSGSGYEYSCSLCHNDDFATTHDTGTFQNVFTGTSFDPLVDGGGSFAPAYDGTVTAGDDGLCSNVYCHSNGGMRTGDGTSTYSAASIPAWQNGKGGIATCNACHGNDATSMNGLNSASHLAHLNKGYACNVCHDNTAANATNLVAGAEGDFHVDGDADVLFDNDYSLGSATLGTGTYANVAGTCSIYCHSDGAGNNATPDWDDAATGACGTCHSNPPTSGSHPPHIDVNGANIACDECHGANAASGAHSGHVNGAFTVVSGVCDSCHAVDVDDGSVTPTWGDSTTDDCRSCHAGSSYSSYTDSGGNTRTAAGKGAYFSAGHGKTSVLGGGTAPNQVCTDCHDATYTADHMDSLSANVTTDRLKTVNGQTYSTSSPNAFCGACHDGGSGNESAHFATGGTSDDGTRCNFCHDPHGVTNYDAMIMATIQSRDVATFGDRTVRGDYANASYNGVCQVCHSTDVTHFNRSTYESGHGGTQLCLDCHDHTLATAFEVSCYGCHGGGSTGSTSGNKNFWPDGSTAHSANQGGEHQVHMLEVAERFNAGWTTVDALLNGATDDQQKQMCEYCHAAVTNDDDHASATAAEVFLSDVGTVQTRYAKKIWDGSDDTDAAYDGTADTCSNVDCHNSKLTADGIYGWYDAGTSACDMCHAADPGTGAHTTHISGTYGPGLGVACGDCHEANDYNTSMSDKPTHVNGTVTFRNAGTPSSPHEVTRGTIGDTANDGVDSCDLCHGGATPALTAKDNWAAPTRVSCESCHGDGSAAATSAADGTGVAAPVRTVNYTTAGHGQTGIVKVCTDCHDNTVAHISGVLDDDNRVKTISTMNFDTAGQENDWCNGCHAAAMPVHYGNSRTAGGNSNDGLYCYQCHDPHGNSGYDAMVHSNIQGRNVASFTDRTLRSQYYNDNGASDNNGVCQVCHELEVAGQVDYFNRTDSPPAHYAGNCISCHQHDDTEAFKPSGCNGCHGDATAENYWPDTSSDLSSDYPDRLGAHTIHVERIGDWIADSIDGTPGSATLADKNASCVYCHPDPGGANRDGGGHDSNTTGSGSSLSDVYNDGVNLLSDDGGNAKFRYIEDASLDADGSFNPTIKRCSNIDCHSNGDFTWTWYEDAIAPEAITDLTAASGSDPGTVTLTWTPPDNDNNDGPVAYGYEVRYATSAILNDTDWGNATIAGGPPTAIRNYGTETQEMTVYGLTPGTTYYFAVKTFDEVFSAGVPLNWSPLSNSPSAAATSDAVAPMFIGLESATPAFASGAVNLFWSPARDDSEPLSYKVWWSENAAVDFGVAPNATTSGTSFQATGLTNGNNYFFAVRATDSAGNTDANTVEKEAIPQAPAEMPWNGKMYYATPTGITTCGGAVSGGTYTADFSDSGYTCATGDRTRIDNFQSGHSVIWKFTSNYATATNIQGGRFTIYVRENDEVGGTSMRLRLGYWDGSAFTELGSVQQEVPANMRGGFNFGLAAITGQVPAGNAVAVKLESVDGNYDLRFGSERNDSFLSVFEQEQNDRPDAFTVNTPAPGTPAGDVAISWNTASDPDGDTVYYDVYGSIDNGVSYPFIIADGITATSTTWDTLADGIGLSAAEADVYIKVAAGDGMKHNEGGTYYDHREALSGVFTIDNTVDNTPPADVTDLAAEHRPKTGTVYLYWRAPGDDGSEGKASSYDIRYMLASDESGGATGLDTSTEWTAATAVTGEPVPREPGHTQGYEVLGLQAGIPYYFALKTVDDAGNWSGLSNSPTADGGLRCGVCHSTPPDDMATRGTHDSHGYTQTDCSKCHGAESDTFDTGHADGTTKMAWNNPRDGYINTAAGPDTLTDDNVVYDDGVVNIYTDSTGGGGFNDLDPAGAGDNVDNGTCSGFNASGVTGCHGTGTPIWNDDTSVNCAMCHGDPARTDKDPNGRTWEDLSTDDGYRIDYAGATPIYKSAPGIDLQGNNISHQTGQHLRHLNFSYRFTGDQCDLCHLDNEHADGVIDITLDPTAGAEAQYIDGSPGTCIGTSEMRCHGDNADPPTWETRDPYLTGSKLIYCNECHTHQDNVYWQGTDAATAKGGHSATVDTGVIGDDVTDQITVTQGVNPLAVGDRFKKGDTYFQINAISSGTLTLHKAIPVGINFSAGETLQTEHIPHVYDDTGAGLQVQACTHCHVEGHPQGDETAAGTNPTGEETVFIPNYSIAGIDYSAGGIHLRKDIAGRGAKNTEAEICWTCHAANGISEWGTNTNANTGDSTYDYGSLNQNNWVGAIWSSAIFSYKDGTIQSTHSVNPAVTAPGVDTTAQIRCSYCHDVHDMNQAIGDNVDGAPYLRGTWLGNPYKEDGAPGRNDRGTVTFEAGTTVTDAKITYYPYNLDYGGVPRGDANNSKLGGYWIDQNSGYPTATWSLEGSAGLCTLCHGADVENMNKFGVAADDWVGTNGHSNAAIGGTGSVKANVYSPDLRQEGGADGVLAWNEPGMGYQATPMQSTEEMWGFRHNDRNTFTPSTTLATSNQAEAGVYPYIWNTETGKADFAFGLFTWGVDRSTTTAEVGYHRFSCSKCHNPHASRLPRLMITNCLDVRHNTWDDLFSGTNDWFDSSGSPPSQLDNDWGNDAIMPYTGTDNWTDEDGYARSNDYNKQMAYATSAQNCHRYVDISGDGTADEAGWNKVTPWRE